MISIGSGEMMPREVRFGMNENKVFRHLSENLYSNTSDTFRELIQNAYDAYASEVKIATNILEGVTCVIDDGIGMNQYIIDNAYTQVGTDEKNTREKHMDRVPVLSKHLWSKLVPDQPYPHDNISRFEEIENRRKMVGSIGQKGIGRFSWVALGVECLVYTEAHEDDEGFILEMQKGVMKATIHRGDIHDYLDMIDENNQGVAGYVSDVIPRDWQHGTIYTIFDESTGESRNKVLDIQDSLSYRDYTTPINIPQWTNLPHTEDSSSSLIEDLMISVGWLVKETPNFEIDSSELTKIHKKDYREYSLRVTSKNISQDMLRGVYYEGSGVASYGGGKYEYDYKVSFPTSSALDSLDDSMSRLTTIIVMLNQWMGVKTVWHTTGLSGYINTNLELNTSRDGYVAGDDDVAGEIRKVVFKEILKEMSDEVASGDELVQQSVRDNLKKIYDWYDKVGYRLPDGSYITPQLKFRVWGIGQKSMIDVVKEGLIGRDGKVWIQRSDKQDNLADRASDSNFTIMKIPESSRSWYGFKEDIGRWSSDFKINVIEKFSEFDSSLLSTQGESKKMDAKESEALEGVGELLEETDKKLDELVSQSDEVKDSMRQFSEDLEDAINKDDKKKSDNKDNTGDVGGVDFDEIYTVEKEIEEDVEHTEQKKLKTTRRRGGEVFRRDDDDYKRVVFRGTPIKVGIVEFADNSVVGRLDFPYIELNRKNRYISEISNIDNKALREMLLIEPMSHELAHISEPSHSKRFTQMYTAIYQAMVLAFKDKHEESFNELKDEAEENLLTQSRLYANTLSLDQLDNYNPSENLRGFKRFIYDVFDNPNITEERFSLDVGKKEKKNNSVFSLNIGG